MIVHKLADPLDSAPPRPFWDSLGGVWLAHRLWGSLKPGRHSLPSGVTGVSVTLLASLSGHSLLLRLVLGAAGDGLPVQPVAQHAEFWGRRSPAAPL